MRKRAVLDCRVSADDQDPEKPQLDLCEFARQRGFEIAHEHIETDSGTKSKRPGLDRARGR